MTALDKGGDRIAALLTRRSAERFWSDRYIQHSAHIAPGREGLFALIRTAPETLRYENHLIVAEGDYVITHGRFSGNGRPAAWIAADIVRFEDGKLAEHWDVLQDEATTSRIRQWVANVRRPLPRLNGRLFRPTWRPPIKLSGTPFHRWRRPGYWPQARRALHGVGDEQGNSQGEAA